MWPLLAALVRCAAAADGAAGRALCGLATLMAGDYFNGNCGLVKCGASPCWTSLLRVLVQQAAAQESLHRAPFGDFACAVSGCAVAPPLMGGTWAAECPRSGAPWMHLSERCCLSNLRVLGEQHMGSKQ